MYQLIDDAKNWEPIPGVPWRDLSDEEFAAVSAEYDARFSDEQKGSLSRWFKKVPEPAPVARATSNDKTKPASGQED